ncbi:D111/G-patch domain-containing protein [Tieghemostelium lacteum]|uniref:D111/G-patch domain-containing protein n=1 Tax=Tieghemostelium lacteum TaxID=361077 RepID=A0A152A8I1_TIELA|nr:D111/G-patch domain-containing protein [Tieghemostelium lacteum]|eukprot:KYR02559.1 D111/G-patch domain-containing protein [Tieghemostelium lacteum]
MSSDEDDLSTKYYKKRRYTKEDSIYGVFNSSHLDDDTEDSEYTYGRSTHKPINFVSSGVYEINENIVSNDNSTEKQQHNDESDGDKQIKKKYKLLKEKKKKRNSSSGSPVNHNSKTSAVSTTKAYSGIGSSILSKLGYSGSGGLGSDGSGVSEPIKVHVRTKATAGFGFFKEGSGDEYESDEDEDDYDTTNNNLYNFNEGESPNIPKSKSNNWKKKETKKQLDDYITSQQKENEIKSKLSELSNIKPQLIIDMTNPNAQIYKGQQQQQLQQQQKPNGKEPLEELKYNIDLLVNLKISEIQSNQTKLQNEQDRKKNLETNLESLRSSLSVYQDKTKNVNEIQEIITKCKCKLDENQLNIESLYRIFLLLFNEYPKEYQHFRLNNLERELLRPLLVKMLKEWDITKDSGESIAKEFRYWREFFDQTNNSDHTYFIMVRDIWLPVVKNYFRNQWSVKESFKVAVEIIVHWTDSIPELMIEGLLEQSILPRLVMEIDQWDAVNDPLPISQWLIPWVPLLKEHLISHYPTIRQKIIPLLTQYWNPLDTSALELLRPWKSVFEGTTMESLLNRAIIPKLTKSVQGFKFDPSNQSSESIQSVTCLFPWLELVSISVITNIFEQHFFNKFQYTLLEWLKNPNSDFAEISNWYQGWKKQFPIDFVKSSERIQNQFAFSLSLMKKAMAGDKLPNEIVSVNSQPTTPPPQPQPIKNITKHSENGKKHNVSLQHDTMSTRQIIEQLASKHGILFIPSQRKTDNGQQIYTFGKTPIVIEKDLILCFSNSKWEPANIQFLLDVNK